MWPGVTMEEQSSSLGAAPTPAPKSKAVWIVVAVIVVVVVVLAAAVLGGVFNAGAKAPLRIGTMLSLTGGLSLFGPGDQLGADLAVKEINAAGGVLGQKIEIFHEDDQTNTVAAAAAASKLVTVNHVNAIVGAQFSGGSLAALPIASDNGVAMVSPSATSVKLSDLTVTKGWFARTISSDALQGAVAGSYLYKNTTEHITFKYANVIVINNAYGNGLGANFKTKFEAYGGKVNRQVFIDQIHAVGVDVTKVWGTAPAAPISSLYDAFSTRYKAEYFNRTPVLYASHSYDAVYLIALAAQKAGAVDGASIKAHLREVSGPSGTVINGGDWSKAVTTIASGGAINWEGAAGSENLNTTNDPGVGSYEIWGVNSSFGITRRAFYTEALVGSLGTRSEERRVGKGVRS